MASKLIPSAVKRAIKRQTGISNLQNRLEGVSRRVDELRQKTTLAASELAQVRAIQSSQREKELEAQVAAMSEQVKRLQALYEYSILRPIDLVTFQNHYYFWYKNDATYPNASTRLDEVKLPTPFPFSVQEFWDSRCDEFPNWEQRCKFLLFAYFWLHDIDFTFLDIGANVGTTCIPCGSFIQRFGKKNRIYTFEPGMVGNLCRNSIVVNGLADIIQFEPRAVTKSSGAMVMHSWLQHSESNSLCDFRKHYPTLDLALASLVPTVSVDDFVQEKVITNSLFVKIDAEGQDWPVIQGMSQSLKGQVKAFMFELLPAYIKEFSEPAEVLESFAADWYMLYTPAMDASWNFRCFGVDTSDFGQFVRAVESSPLGWVDILLLSKKLPHLDELVAKLCQ